MATNEVNGLLTVKDKEDNLYIVYPVTKLENISDLEIATTSLDGLMSKADKAKLDGFDTDLNSKIDKATKLTNEDLNTITTEGFYYADDDNTCPNKPAQRPVKGFGLQVNRNGTSLYASQILIGGGSDRYFRHVSNNAWSDWTMLPRIKGYPVDNQVLKFDGTYGGIVASGFTIAKSVPADAKFTDTTYNFATNNMSGLMTAADKSKLDGIEKGAQKNTVTGVKGNAESSYRTGNINITPANIGLGNVNNTSDANKPISTAAKNALDTKISKSTELTNEDLNTITTEGFYHAADANTCANKPSNVKHFGMWVFRTGVGGASGNHYIQFLYSDNLERGHIRYFDGSNISKWFIIPNSADLAKCLPITGGTMTGQIATNKVGGTWIAGRNNALIAVKSTPASNFTPVFSAKTTNGSWQVGAYTNDELYFVYTKDTDVTAGNNNATNWRVNPNTGVLTGLNIAGNADTATKLQTARTINGVAFDGTQNISIDAVTAAQLQEVKNSVSDGKTKVANAITGKGISTATNATFDTMANNINAITTLSQGTADATATAAQILSGKTAYVKGSKITGTIPSKGAATITPGTSNQTIAAGQYLSGAQIIKGDANLKAENIKSGVSILGIKGNLESQSGITQASKVQFWDFSLIFINSGSTFPLPSVPDYYLSEDTQCSALSGLPNNVKLFSFFGIIWFVDQEKAYVTNGNSAVYADGDILRLDSSTVFTYNRSAGTLSYYQEDGWTWYISAAPFIWAW